MISDYGFKLLNELVISMPWTIALTAASFLFGVILAVPLCIMRLSRVWLLRNTAYIIILIFRSIPPLVWLFLIFFGVGSSFIDVDPFTASVIGLGLISAANMAEIYRGAIKAVPAGQYEAATVLGLSTIHQYRYVLIPQIFRVALPSLATYAIGLLKDTAIASTIGVHDMALSAYRITQETFRGLETYAAFGIAYFIISIFIAFITRGLDGWLRARISR